MKSESIKNWLIKIFIRDIHVPKSTLIYLLFSLISITLIAEAFLFKYYMLTSGVLFVGVEIYIFLIVLASSFLISGILIDILKNRTRYFNLTLLISIIGLFISALPGLLLYYIGLLVVIITIPQLIITWFTIFVHETNILNRGRLTAYFLISSFLVAFVSIIFIMLTNRDRDTPHYCGDKKI